MEKHRRLLAHLSLETNIGLDHKYGLRVPHPVRKRAPLRHCQHHAKMRHGDIMAIDGVMRPDAARRWIEMGDNLMPEEIEIDPMIR